MAYIVYSKKGETAKQAKTRFLNTHDRRKYINWFLLAICLAETSYIVWMQIN